ncbi:hypothetical protein LTS03_011961, partial [Exophiala xenobiotica]
MSSNQGNSTAQKARDSLASLLGYYYQRPAYQESIKIGLEAGQVPSIDQAEALKKELKEALQDKLSQQVTRMANLSR